MKAMRSRELDAPAQLDGVATEDLLASLERPSSDRFDVAARGRCAAGPTLEDVHGRTQIDPWFLRRARGDRARPRGRLRRRALVQGGRHLRRGVRRVDAVLLLGLGAHRPTTRCAAATAPRS